MTTDYPHLEIVSIPQGRFLRGFIDIIDNHGVNHGNFNIQVESSSDYPHTFPIVKEIGNAFPHNPNWHIYNNTNQCCFTAQLNEKLICLNGITLNFFFKTQIIPYFANQLFRKENGYYKNGEYAHIIQVANLQAIQDIFDTSDPIKIAYIFNWLFNKPRLKEKDSCPICGKVLKYCHKDLFNSLYKMKNELSIYANFFISRFHLSNSV